MTVEFSCRDCQTTLRVADEHIGKKARCPSCGSIQDVVGQQDDSSAESGSKPIGELPERWLMRTPDGNEYGPVPKNELDQWMREGRVSAQCSLRQENQSQWNPASLVYPNLASATSAPSPQISSSGNPFAAPMQQPHRQTYQPRRTYTRAHNGVTVLVLGILALVFPCIGIILGPIAWAMGSSELGALKRGEIDPDAHGIIMAGYVLGIIATCFWGLMILLACCGNIANL